MHIHLLCTQVHSNKVMDKNFGSTCFSLRPPPIQPLDHLQHRKPLKWTWRWYWAWVRWLGHSFSQNCHWLKLEYMLCYFPETGTPNSQDPYYRFLTGIGMGTRINHLWDTCAIHWQRYHNSELLTMTSISILYFFDIKFLTGHRPFANKPKSTKIHRSHWVLHPKTDYYTAFCWATRQGFKSVMSGSWRVTQHFYHMTHIYICARTCAQHRYTC